MKNLSTNIQNCAIMLVATTGLIGCGGMVAANQEQVGQQQLLIIRGVCNGRGFQEGTPQFTGCVYEVGTQMFGGPGQAQHQPAPPVTALDIVGLVEDQIHIRLGTSRERAHTSLTAEP